MRYKKKGLQALAWVLTFALLLTPTTAFAHDHGGSKPTTDTPAADLRADLGLLLSEHTFLAVVAMQKGADGADDFDQVAAALNQNTEDLAAAIAKYYGKEAGERFKEIWSEHIEYAVDYVVATGEGDEKAKEKAAAEQEKYIDELTTFLADANPEVDRSEVEKALSEHVDYEVMAFDSYVEQDFDAAYQQLRKGYKQAFGLGDWLAWAIVAQFPEKFDNSNTATPAADLRILLSNQLSEHAALALLTMQKGADGADDFENAAAALNENTEELTKSIASVYGKEAGEEFKRMWNDHIGFFVDYVTATGEKDEDGKKEALANLDAYRGEFAQFLAGANPNLEAKGLADGLQMHVDHLVVAFDSYVEKDYDAVMEQFRESHAHMFGTGAALSGAIVAQFPEKFEDDTPEGMPKTGHGGLVNSLWMWVIGIAGGLIGFRFFHRPSSQS